MRRAHRVPAAAAAATGRADGTLAAYNTRSGKLEQRSDLLETELLSCAVLKRGKARRRRRSVLPRALSHGPAALSLLPPPAPQLVVAGSQEGVLYTYMFGLWADCRSPRPPFLWPAPRPRHAHSSRLRLALPLWAAPIWRSAAPCG
eukprot:SAG11_NODE_5365_length_1581_cov_1.889339_2_plen_146_part_00